MLWAVAAITLMEDGGSKAHNPFWILATSFPMDKYTCASYRSRVNANSATKLSAGNIIKMSICEVCSRFSNKMDAKNSLVNKNEL